MGKLVANAERIGVALMSVLTIAAYATHAAAAKPSPREELSRLGFENIRPTPDKKVAESFPWQANAGSCTFLFDKADKWIAYYKDPYDPLNLVVIHDASYAKVRNETKLRFCFFGTGPTRIM